jgi:hypothetical protein
MFEMHQSTNPVEELVKGASNGDVHKVGKKTRVAYEEHWLIRIQVFSNSLNNKDKLVEYEGMCIVVKVQQFLE